MRAKYFSFLFLTAFFAHIVTSETITIQDCDDISLINSAYANDKFPSRWKKADSDTLMMNMWKC